MTPANPVAVQEEVRRNSKCPCGSGLKFKRCHGNAALQQECRLLVQLMVYKRITEARGRARLMPLADCEVLVSRLNNQMIDLIVGPEDAAPPEPNPEVEPVTAEAEEIPAKIITTDVKDLQKDLDRCPRCGRATYGKECIKCKETKQNGETVA